VVSTARRLFVASPAIQSVSLPALCGNRVEVRALTARDTPALLETIDDEVATANRWTQDNRRQMVELCLRSPRLVGMGIIDIESGCLAGVVQMTQAALNRPYLSIWVGPEYRRRGFSSDALAIVAEQLHDTGVRVVEAETAADNMAMRGALERAGFTIEGNRNRLFDHDIEVPSVIYRHVPPVYGTVPRSATDPLVEVAPISVAPDGGTGAGHRTPLPNDPGSTPTSSEDV
jgi:RimJ/RimL family protein N-acetyltransferase